MENRLDIFYSESYQKALREAYEKRCDHDEANLIQARREGREEGIEIGKEEGREEGRRIVNELYKCLIRDNRWVEIQRSFDDRLFFDQLIEEYHL